MSKRNSDSFKLLLLVLALCVLACFGYCALFTQPPRPAPTPTPVASPTRVPTHTGSPVSIQPQRKQR